MTASLEQFSNLAQTTLDGSILAGATSLVVTSVSGFSATGNFRIIIENEIFIVTAVSGTTFTVIPGSEGTTQASHTSGVKITQVFTAGSFAAAFQPMPVNPGGRLTLVANMPVMTADEIAKTTIYYCAFIGDWVPNWNGVSWQSWPLDTELSLALDSNASHTGYQQSGNLFDIFATVNSGSLILCTGPAWTNTTTRSAALALLNGLWTNAASMTGKIDATSTTITVAANQGTYLGTMYATADGQTSVIMNPAAAAGGSNNIIGICNAYNLVPFVSTSQDSTTSYTYGTKIWRVMDNSDNNSISFIDALGTLSTLAMVQTTASLASSTAAWEIGTNINSTSATPAPFSYVVAGSTTLSHNYKTATCINSFPPTLGFNTIYGMENSPNGTSITFNPVSGTQALVVQGLH